MSGADLLEDGVPHGTTAGYDAGCRSLGGCPGKDGRWAQTCTAAKSRSRMEFGYSKAVAKGREVELLEREVEARLKPTAVPAEVARAKASQRKQQGVPAQPVVEAAEVAANAAFRHGTTWGYARGCKDSATCPRGADGRSCTEAQNEYQREYRARKKAELREQRAEVAADVPEPIVEVDPDQTDVVSPIERPEEPRPRGKRVLDDALRTLTESLELQRALAEIGERALRTIRIEINHLRRESAAQQNQQEK